MSEQLSLLPGYLNAHLQLSLAALVAGALVSLPLGILVTRRRSLETGVLGFASVVQTIPSLALLAIMVPVLAAVGGLTDRWFGVELSSIGPLPAVVALTLYSMLPMLRNTVTGIAGVDPALVEAARGVGMTPRQRLLRVELPLALPVIVAGLRTATVWVVGTATLSTPVGATSLGNFIFSGLQTRNTDAVLVGCIAAAGLAIALDQAIRLLEAGLGSGRRRLVAGVSAFLLALLLWSAGSFAAARWGNVEQPVRIGAKSFTEQYILSELLAGWIARETRHPTELVSSLGSTVAFDALRQDEIDVYVDYSGTIWATVLERGDPPSRAAVLAAVTEALPRDHGVSVAAALGFENTYALAMRADHARELGLRSISDLVRRAPRLSIGADYEFFVRNEWKSIVEAYGIGFREQRTMDPALMYQALAEGQVDVISAYSTDGRIAAYDLVLLEDDRAVIPPYDAIVLVGSRLQRDHPEVVEALRALGGRIDEATMQRLNHAVDADGQLPGRVARDALPTLDGRGGD